MTDESKAVVRRRQLREALIDAAEKAVAADGLRGMKARELALQVGCAVGAIYNVFADLDDLVFAVNALTLDQLEKTLTVAGGDGADPQADAIKTLVHLALAYTDYAAANTPRWRALFDHQPERARPEWYSEHLRRLFDYIDGPLTILKPDASAAERALLARSMFSAIHGLVALGLEEKLQELPLPILREQVVFIVTAIGKGLAEQSA
jgi:AcrR family transcriptional regulator